MRPTDPRRIHPVAELFPMMGDDDLVDLAEDIKQRGLLHPIVLDGPEHDGWLLDGRNRLKACELAGIEPTFTIYEDGDPIGYILATNINRRHLTKGQQAMIAASAVQNLDSTSVRKVAVQNDISKSRISQAFVVLDHASDMADAVRSGAMGLDKAYEVARERKTAADSVDAQLVRLRAEDPELADRVVEGELSLPGAWAERKERAKREAIDREAGRSAASRIVADLKSAVATIAIAAQLGEPGLVTADMVAACRDSADLLDKILKEGGIGDER